jgi:cbb3-type cytochrome oxidase subunit 3
MFKQFIQNFADSRIYLISSLWLFLVFFLLVAFMLIRMKKNHIEYMSNLPLAEDEEAGKREKEALTSAG